MLDHTKYIILKIATDNITEASKLIGRESTGKPDSGHWEYEIIEGEGIGLNTVIDVYEELRSRVNDSELDFSDVTIWILYAYDSQCDMEFDVETLTRLSLLRIYLCISCWEK